MRTIILVFVACLLLAASPAGSFAKQISVTVTQSQVANVCGKKLTSSGPYSGCTVGCGNKQLCDYECKGDKCTGTVVTALQVEPGRTRLFSIQEQVSEIQLSGACDLAGGTFSSLGSKFQCLAMNGDILTCDGTSHVCVGQVHAAARPPTLFGFATMPFGGGATVGGSTKSLASEEGGNNNNAAPPPVLY